MVSAQKSKKIDSYNFLRGLEAFEQENYEEALEYLDKEMQDNPDNGKALVFIASIRNNQGEYGLALTTVNSAIKIISKKDKNFRSLTFTLRAKIYTSLDKIDNALEDYTSAIRLAPDNVVNYEERADLYYYLENYELAERDYKKMIALEEGNMMGYMGLGTIAYEQKRYTDAIKYFDFVTRLAPNYASGYSSRAESYIALKDFDKAIEDVIKALDIDRDRKAFKQMKFLAVFSNVPLKTKLKIQTTKNPHDFFWQYCLGVVYEDEREYHKAIEHYKNSFALYPSGSTLARISFCYEALDYFENALYNINEAISLDTSDYIYLFRKANILNELGRKEEAIANIDKYMLENPNYGSYYKRGWFKDHGGNVDGAIDDYTMSIGLNPGFIHSYLSRGILWYIKGDKENAQNDFKHIIDLDSVPNDNSCAQYAYFYMGDNEKAIDFLNRILEKYNNAGKNYDAACLYSIMGEKEKAVYHLGVAFEKGFRRFAHVRADKLLNNIREMEAFKNLLNEYETKHQAEIEINKDAASDFEEVEMNVPFTKMENVYKVKCEINGLPLHFIFDTGASFVSMSTVEATFMLKNNYLSTNDIVGKQNFMTADGNISEGTVINLRRVNFGGTELNNVKASIVENQKAPLLLGQSVLNKLGKIEIDNENQSLKITSKQKK